MCRIFAFALIGAFLISCNSGSEDPLPEKGCQFDHECSSGKCVDGKCQNTEKPPITTNIDNPDNPVIDSDCDGLSDAEEFATLYAGDKKTDPGNPDTDGDGIPDGVEAGRTTNLDASCTKFVGDVDPNTTTTPTDPDTDADGCPDGAEDKNHDGKADAHESDPTVPNTDCSGVKPDSDGDGIPDETEELIGTDPKSADSDGDGLTDAEEDKNANGQLDPKETNPKSADTDNDGLSDYDEINVHGTDPQKVDTDGDGIPDDAEVGVSLTCDKKNLTDPSSSDTDGDGISDGVEDPNHNGCLDAGEKNPKDAGDVSPTDQKACAENQLKPVQVIERRDQRADMTLALASQFSSASITTLKNNGYDVGAMFWDNQKQIAGFALKIRSIPGNTPGEQLTDLEKKVGGAGSMSSGSKLAQTFTTWDKFSAIVAQYDWNDNGNETVGKAANDLVKSVYPSITGLLTNMGSEKGIFRLKIELVRRSSNSTVVIGALANKSSLEAKNNEGDAKFFQVEDVTNGSAVGQYGDQIAVQCDRLTVPSYQPIDFIWVVDNSGSMETKQNAVKQAAQQMGVQLSNSTADWRLAVIASDADAISCSSFSSDGKCNDPAGWNNCTYPNSNISCPNYLNISTPHPRFCEFTRDTEEFKTCMGNLGTSGHWNEMFFRPVACLLGRESPVPSNSTLSSNSCGRPNVNASNYYYQYTIPPDPYVLLKRSATENRNKLRDNSLISFIFLTDTNDHSDNSNQSNVNNWVDFFLNIDEKGTALSKAFVAGIVCAAGMKCYDLEDRVTNTWSTFFDRMGGAYADLALDSDPQQAAKIQAAVAKILDLAIGKASTLTLTKSPISSTIKVAIDAELQGACNKDDIPRSRTNGFDYDGAANAIKLYGNCRPKKGQEGKPISVSYRYWIDKTPNPDGLPTCPDNKIYSEQEKKCVCLPTCGLACGLGYECDNNCECQCMNSQTCKAGYLWSQEKCTCVCDTSKVQCGSSFEVDENTCSCACKRTPDCGGCPEGSNCNLSYCSCSAVIN